MNRTILHALLCFVWLCAALAPAAPAEFTTKPLPDFHGTNAGFHRLPPAETGILFTNLIADIRAITNRNLLSGSGVALADVDGDQRCDIYFCGLDNDNALYRNLGGWKFENITARAGVACPAQDSTGAVFADVDGDGDADLLVAGLGSGARLFLNDGQGAFKESTDAAGLRSKTGAMSMTLADVEGDGDLDLYVVNYRPTTLKDIPDAQFRVEYVGGRPVVTHFNGQPLTLPELTNRFSLSPGGEVLELGETDQLFLNDGSGKFTLAPYLGGRFLEADGSPAKSPEYDWGLAALFYDFNGDLAPDLYLCNDLFPPDRAWLNDGRGNFRALTSFELRSISTFSMGVDFADLNRDGHADFFVTDMLSRHHTARQVQVGETVPIFSPPGAIDNRPQKGQNTLQLNRGDGTFAEIGEYAGVEASEWSWGPIFLDVDLDGWEDLLISNGNQYDVQNADVAAEVARLKAAKKLNHAELLGMLRRFPRLASRKLIFHNQRDLTFRERGREWGFAGEEISQGMALADLDGDGDQDLVVNNLFTGAGVYRNDADAPRIAVRLKGKGGNTQGIGARLAYLGGAVPQTQQMIGGGRYLSSDDPLRVFAAGAVPAKLEVIWRDGRKATLSGVKPNVLIEISE